MKYLFQMFLKLDGFGLWKRWQNLCIGGRYYLQVKKQSSKFILKSLQKSKKYMKYLD